MDKKRKEITIRPPTFLMNDLDQNCISGVNTKHAKIDINTNMNTNINMTTKCKNKYWYKIRELIINVRKNEYILLTLLEFLSKFKIHISNHVEKGRLQKPEFFTMNENIDNIVYQINYIRKILNKKNILFFDIIWSHSNIDSISNIYLQVLYLLEKYGSESLIYTLNCYLLIYSGLQDIYFLWKNQYFHVSGGVQIKLQPTDTNTQLGSLNSGFSKSKQPSILLPTNTIMNSSSLRSSSEEDSDSSQDDVLFSTTNNNIHTQNVFARTSRNQIKTPTKNTTSLNKYPSTTYKYLSDTTDDIIFGTQKKQVFQVINNLFTQMALQSTSRSHSAKSNMQTPEILNKLLAQPYIINANLTQNIKNSTKSYLSTDYLELLTNNIHTQQLSAFLINGNTQTDLYQALSIFQSSGILKSANGALFNSNPVTSEIYRDLAQHSAPSGILPQTNCNIWTADINNPLIYTTIPNFDKIHDQVVHIFIRIPVCDSYILFIITGLIYNNNLFIGYKYNFTQRQIKYITQSINDLDDIAAGFRTNILKLLTIKQLLTGSMQQITAWCYDKWQLYNTVIKMTLLELMNYFLAQSISRKINILTVLILNSSHVDSTFRAYILCDLLIDENNMQLEKEVFSGLHISIQTKLRRVLESAWQSRQDLEDAQKKEGNIKLDELTYEKRIQLLKIDDTIRSKAFEKLREINNKSTDNSSKPQQYLDGLLSIPFGTYAKEWIIANSEALLEQSRVIIINFICLCYDYRDIYGWSRNALIWVAQTFGLPGLQGFINGLGSHPNSRSASPVKTTVLTTDTTTVSTTFSNPMIIPSQIEDETIVGSRQHDSTIIYSTLEKYLLQELPLSKCGIANIKQLLAYLANQIIAKRVLVNSVSLENAVLTEALASLDITQLQDIQFELEQEDIKIKICSQPMNYQNPNSDFSATIHCPVLLENPKARDVIIECLITEGYFYDIGYPTDIVRYSQHVTELIKKHDQHRADKQRFIQNTRARLDSSIYGQREAKDQIVRIIAQWVNGNQDGYCLGFEGSPGLGKTSLAKYGISQALVDANGKSRPFGFIALGGSANGSILEGHSYTYVGSTWGRIVDILMQSRCMNPIIFIDELDKISNTESGRELIGILTHLTDRTQNNEFMDKYFAGVKLDLSKVLFIFSYNDYSLLDPILADRIHRVRFENYTIGDKVAISRDFLIPRIAAEINMSLPISLDPPTIEYIINSYTYEAGVRKLKEKYYDIYRELNVRDIGGDLNAYEISPTDNSLALTPQLIDSILAVHHKIEIDRPLAIPKVGVVYGLYATGLGIGGLTIIQVSRKLADHGGILLCTGKQGDVMMESMKVALTLACGLVPNSVLEKWGLLSPAQTGARILNTLTNQSTTESITQNTSESAKNKVGEPSTTPADHNNAASNPKWSFHIHVPDGATSKDGPSAGCAITLGLVSLLMDCPVRNDVSMTGEIDMLGHILPIGGLDAKITGSRIAGIREILVPRRNHQDLARIQTRSPEICAGLTIHLVDTIQEVLAHGLVGGWNNSIKY